MLILTSIPGDGSKEDVWRIVHGYLTRWRIEETIRFVKQSYGVEDMRTHILIFRFAVWYHFHLLEVCRAAGACEVCG